MICPACKGSKITTAAHVSYADGSHGYGVDFRCDQCGGSGEAPDEMAEWIRVGREMRNRRVRGKPYMNLRDEAKRRGMDVVTLSRMEMGKIKPVLEHET